MNGGTLSKAFVPLPAGATAVYNSSGLNFYRHADWLGSSRLSSTTGRGVYGDIAYAPFGESYDIPATRSSAVCPGHNCACVQLVGVLRSKSCDGVVHDSDLTRWSVDRWGAHSGLVWPWDGDG